MAASGPQQKLPTERLTVRSKNFDLDGTEENFRGVLKQIAQLHGTSFIEKPPPTNSHESDGDFADEQREYKPYVWKDDSSPTRVSNYNFL